MAGMRFVQWAIVALVVMLVGTSGYVIGRVTSAPVDPRAATSQPVTAPVREITIGRSLNFNATVRVAEESLGSNLLQGVITEVAPVGQRDEGDVVLRIGERPVRVVRGEIPYFRDLRRGDRGRDVAQLRQTLRRLGHLGDGTDELYDAAVETAVKGWQRELGTIADGRVQLGELVVVPRAPVTVLVDPEVGGVGTALVGGEKLLYMAGSNPVFEVFLNETEARQLPDGAQAEVAYENLAWQARLAGSRRDENDQVVFTLAGASGDGPVCVEQCDVLPMGEDLYLPTRIQVVPETTGPAVPVAAVTTLPDGQPVVRVLESDGQVVEMLVDVVASGDGVAIVDGLGVGRTVVVSS